MTPDILGMLPKLRAHARVCTSFQIDVADTVVEEALYLALRHHECCPINPYEVEAWLIVLVDQAAATHAANER